MIKKDEENGSMMDREKFSELAETYHGELLVYARTLTRGNVSYRDIVQDSFVAAWKNRAVFDEAKDFGSWMRGVVRNKWKESLRKDKRLVFIEDDVLESMDSEMSRWQDFRQDGGPSVFLRLERCLTRLPEALLEAIKSFYYDGCSSDQAAQALGVTSATLRKRLERARSGLRDCLGK